MKNKIWLLALLLSVALSGTTQAQETSETSDELPTLFDEIAAYEQLQNTSGNLRRGQHPTKVTYHGDAAFQQQLIMYLDFDRQIKAINQSSLSKNDLISLETMALKLSGKINGLTFKSYLIPFNAEGGFFNSLSSSIKRLPFKAKEDFEAYATWLPTYVDYLNGHMTLMRQGMAEGIMAPKVVVENTLKQLEVCADRDINEHALTQMLLSRPTAINESEWPPIEQSILRVMEQSIWPAYDDLIHFISTEYHPAAYDAPGISQAPGGKVYYEDLVRYFTTLDMSPDEVFERGQSEVARIRQSMEAIVAEVDFQGSFQDFIEYLRTDPQFYASTPQELMSYAAWLSKKAEGELPRLFSHLYKLPFTVAPVPDDIAPTYTGGRYVPGSRKHDRPGTYWVNTYNLPARSLYNIPALTLHEAVPGHHLQIMLAAELEGLPVFRNNFYISAFGEGWGLYSEYLGEEMGMYTTPYDRFGRYTYEMWRACRLVVDVGLHYKGWTREEAVDFLSSNTALSLHEVNTEIDRYIGWPGQALSYKIGEITIKELRHKAEEALGKDFDIKEFHHRILRNGSIPLPSLIREIDDWIGE